MRERFYCTYIVASRSRTLYIGVTGDMFCRVLQHRAAEAPGFTSRYRAHRLVWFERYVSPSRAIAREKQLKRWTRAKKIALIERENPTWQDLSEDWGRSFLKDR
ncbi:MAG: GIY-YIG nuclease family protein [Silvibacterium sp.]